MICYRCNLCQQEVDNRVSIDALRGRGLVLVDGTYQRELLDHAAIHMCLPCSDALVKMYKELSRMKKVC